MAGLIGIEEVGIHRRGAESAEIAQRTLKITAETPRRRG
jgi:hypothetical protein